MSASSTDSVELVTLPNVCLVSGSKDRASAINQMLTHLKDNSLSQTQIEEMLLNLFHTNLIYEDRKSRLAVENAFKHLLTHYSQFSDCFISQLQASCHSLFTPHLKTKTLSGSCLTLLRWSCLLLRTDTDRIADMISVLFPLQCELLYSILACKSNIVFKSASHYMETLWSSSQVLLKLYAKESLDLKDSTPQHLLFISLLSRYCQKTGHEIIVSQLKPLSIQFYNYEMINRGFAHPSMCDICRHVFTPVSVEEFEVLVRSDIQKGLLRNPELSVVPLQAMLRQVRIDMSRFSFEIIKTSSKCFLSSNAVLRQSIIHIFRSLISKTHDFGQLEVILHHLMALLTGSEFKSSTWEQRSEVIGTLEFLTQAPIPQEDLPSRLQGLMTHLLSLSLQEVNENCKIQAMRGLANVIVKTKRIPSNFLSLSNKFIEHKSSLIRLLFLRIVESTIEFDASVATSMIQTTISIVEKCLASPSHANLLTDSMPACLILLKLSKSSSLPQSNIAAVKNFINLNPHPLLQDRFFKTSPEDTLSSMLALSTVLFTDHFEMLTPQSLHTWGTVLIRISIHPILRLRREFSAVVDSLETTENKVTIFQTLQVAFSDFIFSNQVSTDSQVWNVSPAYLYRTIKLIARPFSLDPKSESTVSVFLAFHHPCLREYEILWVKVLSTSQVIDCESFVETNLEYLWDKVHDLRAGPTAGNIVKTLLDTASHPFLRLVVEKLTSYFLNENLLKITESDFEIYQSPPDELFDKSVMPKQVSESNVKRESKMYSFEDQKWEIEMNKKKANENRMRTVKIEELKDPNTGFSSKQIELIQQQISLEQSIRTQLSKFRSDIVFAVNIIKNIIDCQPQSLTGYVSTLLSFLIPLFPNPLASECVIDLYFHIRNVVFPNQPSIGYLITVNTMRLLNPFHPLPKEWYKQSMKQGIASILEKLSQLNLFNINDKFAIRPSSIAYIVPFVNCLFYKYPDVSKTLVMDFLHTLTDINTRTALHFSITDLEQLPISSLFSLITNLHKLGSKACPDQAYRFGLNLLVSYCETINFTANPIPLDIYQTLYQGLFSAVESTRLAAISSLLAMTSVIDLSRMRGLLWRVLVLSHEADEIISEHAVNTLKKLDISLLPDLIEEIPNDLPHVPYVLQLPLAQAITDILETTEFERVCQLVHTLLHIYTEESKLLKVKSKENKPIGDKQVSEEKRLAVTRSLTSCCQFLSGDILITMCEMVFSIGLGDASVKVKEEMRAMGLALLTKLHSDQIPETLNLLENHLNSFPETKEYDDTKSSLIILYATLAKSLDQQDPKIKSIISLLLASLRTPSQKIQEAIANCVAPLIPSVKDQGAEMIKDLLKTLLDNTNYGVRRGAAYGLAGIVKGLGLISLKQRNIITALTEAVQDMKSARHRESALFAFETFSLMLGKLFEPYVIHLLDYLLLAFGDNNQYVREAANSAARTIMMKLSGHGVKQVLPKLIEAVNDDSWRTKVGSIELLGSMAYCVPKQLSQCLPVVVPKLIDVLADSHSKVQRAGQESLKHIGSVIKNPEIQNIVPILIHGLVSPDEHSSTCLDTLINTSFVHVIDPPSLAIVMPIVTKAFQQRSTETKKMAAQIMSSMYSLTDPKDLKPYLDAVIPGLKETLMDPVPEVRHLVAIAFGAIINALEEEGEHLVKWLQEMVISDTTTVDRSGAAEGLAEVYKYRGIPALEESLPEMVAEILETSNPPYLRDGYMTCFVFLPKRFGERFTPYLGLVLPCILQGLADECEYIRDSSMNVAQVIVKLFANEALILFLSEFEQGLEDENWRIRHSSLQLLGDLLYRLVGVTGKMSTETGDDDEGLGNQRIQAALTQTLGSERRDRILASIYICRADVALFVRQAAVHVWKVLISNSARTLREILSQLLVILLSRLASGDEDKRISGARTLGDLVRKLGEKIIIEVLPILHTRLSSEDPVERQGVCVGLSELLRSTSKDQMMAHVDSIVSTVNLALCDPDRGVREAGAMAFNSLHALLGLRVLDLIMQSLFKLIEDPDQKELAYDGLKQLLAVKSQIVLPYIIPRLIEPPINFTGIITLVGAAGEALNPYLNRLITTLSDTYLNSAEEPKVDLAYQSLEHILSCSLDEEGIAIILENITIMVKSQFPEMRKLAARLLLHFIENSDLQDILYFYGDLFKSIFSLIDDPEEQVWDIAWDCLRAILKPIDPKNEQLALDLSLRVFTDYELDVCIATKSLESKGKELASFSNRGITPLFNVLRPILQKGSVDKKKEAAECIKQIIKLTNAAAITHQDILNSVGALMRILSQRFDASTMLASLEAINLIFRKVDKAAKQFFAPVQTTSLKLISEPNFPLREEAIDCLCFLAPRNPRPDSVFKQLIDGFNRVDDLKIKESFLKALSSISLSCTSSLQGVTLSTLMKFLLTIFKYEDETIRIMASDTIGSLIQYLPETDSIDIIQRELFTPLEEKNEWFEMHGICLALGACAKHSFVYLQKISLEKEVVNNLVQITGCDDPRIISVTCIELSHAMVESKQFYPNALNLLFKLLEHSNSNDVRKISSDALEILGKGDITVPKDYLVKVIPFLIENASSKYLPLKTSSEEALFSLLRMKEGDAILVSLQPLVDDAIIKDLNQMYKKFTLRYV